MSARFSYGPGASTRCLKWRDGPLTTSRTRKALAAARFSISRSSGVTYSIAILANETADSVCGSIAISCISRRHAHLRCALRR